MNKINQIYYKTIAVISLLLIASACNKTDEPANFDLLYDLPEEHVVVDSSLMEASGSDVLLLQKSISISIDSLRKKFEIKKIESAKFDFIRIESDIPEGSTLNWISKLSAIVSSSGIAETEVGYYDGSKTDAKVIDLTLKDAYITSFVENESFVLKIYVRVKPPLPASSTSILINSRIRLTLQPL